MKTQELNFIVFVARYLDLFWTHSLYNFVMKILYLVTSGLTVWMIRFVDPWKATYDSSKDTFLHLKFAVLPCFILAIFIHSEFTVLEVTSRMHLSDSVIS